MDERVLAERLISYDTSTSEGLSAAAAFVKGWLESQGIDVEARDHGGLPVLLADVGGTERAPSVVFHAHLDVVPAHAEQFSPRVEGDRLIGRGAYDMKGAMAAMMCALTDVATQTGVRVRFVVVPDEESEDVDDRATDVLIRDGLRADYALTGEPTDLHIGIQAKGVLALTLEVSGVAAHGSTPWLGDNAILKAHDVFRRIETLPFSRESSDLFDRPSINLARIEGGDAFNKVPDRCAMDVDIRFLPNQDPASIIEQIAAIVDVDVARSFVWEPAVVERDHPFVLALCDAVARSRDGVGIGDSEGDGVSDAVSVGRDGASDVIPFQRVGIPAVEFGPVGAGHHGPQEWVSLSSLARYRIALGELVRGLPAKLERAGIATGAVEGRPA